MPSSQPSMQPTCNRQGGLTESSDSEWALNVASRFQLNRIDQPSLNDLFLRTTMPLLMNASPPLGASQSLLASSSDDGLLNLRRILDEALEVCTDVRAQESVTGRLPYNDPSQ